MTARYNVLFNGTEAYKKGMLTLQEKYEDNFGEILPVFLYYDKNNLNSISGDMDRSITKATKLINLHSITAKPDFDPDKEMTEKDKEFYNKNEYNKWVDEAYMLMGKAQFHKHEMEKASMTFSYIHSVYKDEEVNLKSKLWQARLAIFFQRYKEAESILEELAEVTEVERPNGFEFEMQSTWADFYIQNEEYESAIIALNEAIDLAPKKYYRIRYNYILAQLHQQNNNLQKAGEYYSAVVKLNPPYTFTFNARISMALSYEAGSENKEDIERQLKKMLKDDKNIEFHDQIYYALGNLAEEDNNIELAIEYYRESAGASQGNTTQQSKTFLSLADLYYDLPDYINAQKYYDSTITVLDPEYEDYQVIYNKANSLSNLVGYYNAVILQDSVQRLAQMSQPILLAYIDEMIIREEEEQLRKQQEEEMGIAPQGASSSWGNVPTFSADVKWYFYNEMLKERGAREFFSVWGRRKLEDNWRRRNKANEQFFNEEQGGTQLTADSAGIPTEGAISQSARNPLSRDFYLKNIPLTDSAMEESHKTIAISLFNMGEIYGFDLDDFEESANAYEDLLRRYPDYNDRLTVYYRLYLLGIETDNVAMSNKYKNKILNEFPSSEYAKAMRNPDYFKELEGEEQKQYQFYQETYNLFMQGNFNAVRSRKAKALGMDNETLKPMFEYIFLVSEGAAKDTVSFLEDLEAFTQKYAGQELAEKAEFLIAHLTSTGAEVIEQHQIIEAKEIYSKDISGEHFVVVAIPTGRNTNQLVFNIINFNLDTYPELSYDVKKELLDGEFNIAVVRAFEDAKQALDYRRSLIIFNDLWKDVNNEGTYIIVLTEENYNNLMSSKALINYVAFEKELY